LRININKETTVILFWLCKAIRKEIKIPTAKNWYL